MFAGLGTDGYHVYMQRNKSYSSVTSARSYAARYRMMARELECALCIIYDRNPHSFLAIDELKKNYRKLLSGATKSFYGRKGRKSVLEKISWRPQYRALH